MFGLPKPSGRSLPIRERFDCLRRRTLAENPEGLFFAMLALGAAGWFWLLPAFEAHFADRGEDGAHLWALAVWLGAGPSLLDLLAGWAMDPIRRATDAPLRVDVNQGWRDREAALREAEEEVGLPPGLVEVVGPLSPLVSRFGIQVTPYVGVVPDYVEYRPNDSEIAAVFAASSFTAACCLSLRWSRYCWVPRWCRTISARVKCTSSRI